MISLTYLSTASVAYDVDALNDLLGVTRDRNHAAGLTGMLLYAGGHFIQTLEGDEEDVDTTFSRIQDDPRHRNIYVALREEIATRAFSDWSMGFETLSTDEACTLPGFSDYLDGKDLSHESSKALGRAGIFHRVFRDNMR